MEFLLLLVIVLSGFSFFICFCSPYICLYPITLLSLVYAGSYIFFSLSPPDKPHYAYIKPFTVPSFHILLRSHSFPFALLTPSRTVYSPPLHSFIIHLFLLLLLHLILSHPFIPVPHTSLTLDPKHNDLLYCHSAIFVFFSLT